MEANLVKIGNSKGVIIPAKLLKLIGLKEKVNIAVQENKLVISPSEKKVREGWEEMIKKEVENNGTPERLMPEIFEDEENDDWKW
ncbi:AbrB/MazE/SpoVT family DNA-binding domain-containing protein [Salegentibacter sp. F188]|uniref:AbrB/MazE/SpoVT family DNA-binding domain-containing protein n=1 Tax=Autumnicola patrickiae TaxID=3075591 RepID=A0ABU3E476_9FLAO|nr:AbrB/MazE/SpoVT family DNA-binding domain-containing protein [Salegentibacter sp. F188]MDT0690802.1 AbrB/MazE/SpoVT family DNA-binding domain-containing protein [Salegentibacter sp. F188]